jgi:hypothetical protein
VVAQKKPRTISARSRDAAAPAVTVAHAEALGTRALALLAAVRLSRTAGSTSTPIDIAPTIAQTRRVDDPSESNSSRSASLGAAVDASKANEASTSDVAGRHGGHESRRREPWRVR